MLIAVKNRFTGKTNEMDLPVTEEQIRRFEAGEFVQNVFPHLNATQREFLLTGMTEAEQKEIFG
jgi:hypothetical protein